MKPTTENSVPAAPCLFLRNKRMFVPALAEGALDIHPEHNDQSFYWCNKTLTSLGRDDNPVHPCACHSARSCHQS